MDSKIKELHLHQPKIRFFFSKLQATKLNSKANLIVFYYAAPPPQKKTPSHSAEGKMSV